MSIYDDPDRRRAMADRDDSIIASLEAENAELKQRISQLEKELKETQHYLDLYEANCPDVDIY